MIEAAHFIPSEQHRRTRHFDMALDFTHGAIKAVSQGNTYPRESLTDFQTRVNSLFPPNVSSDGRISIPQEYSNTYGTPMLVVEGNENYSLDESFIEQTPAQKRRTLGTPALRDIRIDDQVEYDRLYRSARQHLPNGELPKMPPANYGSANYRIFSISASDMNVSICNRPLVRIRRNALSRSIVGSVICHELTHVDQYDKFPFYSPDTAHNDLIRSELEAYHKQQEFNSALIASPDDSYVTPDLINYALDTDTRADLRHLNPLDDPYLPSEAVKRAAEVNEYPL